MKCVLLAATVLVVLSGSCIAPAQAWIVQSAMIAVAPDIITPLRVDTRMSYAVPHGHVRIFDRRKLGMPCVMPPDMQVALNWPGPACAYTDNFIFLPRRHRLYIK